MQLLMETAPKCVVGEESIEQGLVETETRVFAYVYESSVLEYHIIRGMYFVWKHFITEVSWIIFMNLFNYRGYLSFNNIFNYVLAFFSNKWFLPRMSVVDEQ